MSFSETVQIRGHLLDTGVLSRCVDDVRSLGGDYVIERFDVGKDHDDESYARIRVQTDDEQLLASILMRLNAHGVNLTDPGETVLREVSADGVFPGDFYSTTNLDTQVRLDGRWVDVEQPEMDCGLLVSGEAGARRVRTVPVSDVLAGDQIVCGASGVRVVLPVAEFAEDGHGVRVHELRGVQREAAGPAGPADRRGDARGQGGRQEGAVGRPARPSCTPARRRRWSPWSRPASSTSCSAATRSPRTTSSPRSTGRRSASTCRRDAASSTATSTTSGRSTRSVRAGSIADAVDQGVLTSGVMHALVRGEKQFVLVGSVRDDGPLPDVHTDVIVGQRKMREALDGVGFAIMVATMLHSVATGNLLPASIPLVCVDINPATVTKLADRGSSQARGVVTDIGLFLEQLAGELSPGWNAPRCLRTPSTSSNPGRRTAPSACAPRPRTWWRRSPRTPRRWRRRRATRTSSTSSPRTTACCRSRWPTRTPSSTTPATSARSARLTDDDEATTRLTARTARRRSGGESAVTGFTVLERRDYAVTDEAAVLAAADADHLGRALYQIAEAGGWHRLGDTPGLRRQAGFVAVVQHDDLLAPDPADWPQDLTIEDGELLYEQRDAY